MIFKQKTFKHNIENAKNKIILRLKTFLIYARLINGNDLFYPAKNIIIIRMPELHTAKYVCQVH